MKKFVKIYLKCLLLFMMIEICITSFILPFWLVYIFDNAWWFLTSPFTICLGFTMFAAIAEFIKRESRP